MPYNKLAFKIAAIICLFIISISSIFAKAKTNPTSSYVTYNLLDTSNYYKVANNLFLDIGDIKKQYPVGYTPKWAIIDNLAELQFKKVDYLQGKMIRLNNNSIGLAEFEGKAYVYFSGFLGCSCAALLINNNNTVVINNAPQTFYATDFKQVTSDGKVTFNPCKKMTGGFYDTDGWKLNITLGIDNSQNILVSTNVESLTAQSAHISRNGTNTSSLWTAETTLLPNLMTVEKAWAVKKQKDEDMRVAAAKQKKQEADEKLRELLDKQYEAMLPKVKAKLEAKPNTLLLYKGYTLKSLLSFNKLIGNKTCYKNARNKRDSLSAEISKNEFSIYITLKEAAYYSMDFKPNDIEPHKRDEKFAYIYITTKKHNDLIIQIVARYLICDLEMVKEYTNLLGDKDYDFDNDEYRSMVNYLKTK